MVVILEHLLSTQPPISVLGFTEIEISLISENERFSPVTAASVTLSRHASKPVFLIKIHQFPKGTALVLTKFYIEILLICILYFKDTSYISDIFYMLGT